jgi:hypothetical protein
MHSVIDRSTAVAVPPPPHTRELAVEIYHKPATQWWKIPVAAALVVGALAVIFPFVWMLATSLKPEPEVITYPPHLFPQRGVGSGRDGSHLTAPRSEPDVHN